MPFQAPSWTEFYTCPICGNEFSVNQRQPVSLGCGHTICRVCLATVYNRQCPFDQTSITTDVDNLPINNALLQLLDSRNSKKVGIDNETSINIKLTSNNNNNENNNGESNTDLCDKHIPLSVRKLNSEDFKCYKSAQKCIEELAQYLKSFVTNSASLLTRPMLRKLVTLVNCQLMEEEGRTRAVRTARLLGERTVTELLLQHQNPQQLSLYLWAAVRSRGCQFLGPAMQEEVLKLVLQALENGSALSRKVLVMYVVQRLVENFLPASKTSIGHVVQLLYRASCFKVSKREGDSSLMQLKEEFRNYEALRREHDAQIVQIATEAGLRIAPDQWSSLLYGNTAHKSHMQSICDTLQSPSSFAQSVQELVLALQRTGDPTNLFSLRPHLKHLTGIDPSLESPSPSWQDVENALDAVRHVVLGLVKFVQFHSNRKAQDYSVSSANANGKYKISLCRDLTKKRVCPRGPNCTFAHSTEERQRYRAKNRRNASGKNVCRIPASTSQSTENADKEFQQQPQQSKQIPSPSQAQNQHIPSMPQIQSSSEPSSSPIKLKNSPMHHFTVKDNTACMVRNSGVEGAFGDSTTHSPLTMQASLNVLHPTPLVSSGTMPPAQTFENVPFGPMNHAGKLVRIPPAGMNVPPNMRSPNNRGPTQTGMHTVRPMLSASTNMAASVNPPNIQSTNPNKSLGSPLSKKSLFSNPIAADFYAVGPIGPKAHSPSLFNNTSIDANATVTLNSPLGADFPLGFAKSKMKPSVPSASTPLWDTQQQCQPLLNPHELIQSSNPQNPNQHHLMFMSPATDIPTVFEKNSSGLLSDNFIFDSAFCSNNNNDNSPELDFMDHTGNTLNENMLPPAGQNILWSPCNNSNNNNLMGATSILNSSPAAGVNENNAMNIETATPSLFRDRDSFVRSDSILDDDASTYDVPTTTAALGSKYGPICPMYKGFTPSPGPNPYASNAFSDNWDKPNQNPTISMADSNFSMFSMDNDNTLAMSMQKHMPQPMTDSSTSVPHPHSAFDNFNSMQAALSKLSLNFNSNVPPANAVNVNDPTIGGNLNNFKFDLNPLSNILGSKSFSADLGKTTVVSDDHIWNNSNNSKQSTMSLNLNNFWGDDISYSKSSNLSTVTMSPATPFIVNRQHRQIGQQQQQQQEQHAQQQQQEQHHRTTQEIDESYDRAILRDSELDARITEIVEKIWPCADDNVKLD
uniref:RING-type E3 ubiquitin transferase n=1 Tax=Glossina brevipalpis TaxID=37001 RepID=A0A1A9WD37_9MUSC